MNTEQYVFTNQWYESDRLLIKDFHPDYLTGGLTPIYLTPAEEELFFGVKRRLDPSFQRDQRCQKLGRILAHKKN